MTGHRALDKRQVTLMEESAVPIPFKALMDSKGVSNMWPTKTDSGIRRLRFILDAIEV